MPRIAFSPNILSHVTIEVSKVSGESVIEVLESVFAVHPRLRGYLFDDDGSVRKHIAMIVNGEPIQDRTHLTDPMSPDDELFIMQALSGG